MNKATLSVVLTSYNYGDFVGTALDAICSQSFTPIEFIVVDDCSTDNSLTIIEQFQKQNSLIRLLRNEKNMGVMFSVFRALEQVTGDYCYSASADDKILPGFFEKSMDLLVRYPRAGLCFSDPATFDGATGLINEHRLHLSKGPCYFSPSEMVEIMRRRPAWIGGHATIVKQSSLLEAGGYLPQLKWYCDWFALLVIAFRHGACYIPEPLSTYRVSPNAYSVNARRNWVEQRKVLCDLLGLLKSPAYRDVLPAFERSGVLRVFRSGIIRALLNNPAHWDLDSFLLVKRSLRDLVFDTFVPLGVKPAVRKIYYRHISKLRLKHRD